MAAVTYLLDTSVFSQPIRDVPHEAVMERWSRFDDRTLCISALVHAEVMQGLLSRDAERFWRRYRELLEGRYVIIPFDGPVAEVYARLVVELKRTGKTKPMVDLMIAATAKHHGLIVATLNIRDFEGIPGVAVEDWSGS